MDKLLSVKQAAELIRKKNGQKVSPDWVRMLCERGRIKCQKVGSFWVVAQKEILKYKPRKAGRKKVKRLRINRLKGLTVPLCKRSFL